MPAQQLSPAGSQEGRSGTGEADIKRCSSFDLHEQSNEAAPFNTSTDSGHVDLVDDVDISFARSGGAGGQNVNKVNTKADIRLNVDKIGWLDDDMKEALRKAVRGRQMRI